VSFIPSFSDTYVGEVGRPSVRKSKRREEKMPCKTTEKEKDQSRVIGRGHQYTGAYGWLKSGGIMGKRKRSLLVERKTTPTRYRCVCLSSPVTNELSDGKGGRKSLEIKQPFGWGKSIPGGSGGIKRGWMKEIRGKCPRLDKVNSKSSPKALRGFQKKTRKKNR